MPGLLAFTTAMERQPIVPQESSNGCSRPRAAQRQQLKLMLRDITEPGSATRSPDQSTPGSQRLQESPDRQSPSSPSSSSSSSSSTSSSSSVVEDSDDNQEQVSNGVTAEKRVTFARAAMLTEKFDVPPEVLAMRKKNRTESKNQAGNTLCVFYWLLVAFIVMLISFTIWLSVRLTHKHYEAVRRRRNEQLRGFGFDDLFNSSLQPRQFTGSWLQGGDVLVYRVPQGPLVAYYAGTNTTSVLMYASVFDELKTDMYFVSPDMAYVLLAYDVRRHWRHSYRARYKIYDRTAVSGKQRLLDFPNDDHKDRPLQYAGWAQTGHVLSFVFDNNLYVQDSPHELARPLTDTGQPDVIFNGSPDWLYEGEILRANVAHWWSHDDRYVCYLVLNCSLLSTESYSVYDTDGGLYASTVVTRIPKAGDPSGATTRTELFVIDTHDISAEPKRISPPTPFENADHYISRVKWKGGRHVAVVWTSRSQNESYTYICECRDAGPICSKNFHQSVENGWIDQDDLYFHGEDNAYLTILPKEEGMSGNWRHLSLISSTPSSRARAIFLTEGMQEVMKIVGYDRTTRQVYYLSTNGDSRHRHLLRVGLPSSEPQYRDVECLTCSVTSCTYVDASFSDDGLHYVLSCLGPDVPSTTLRATHGSRAERGIVVTLEDNDDLRELLQDKIMPITRFITVPLDYGYDAWVKITIPHDTEEDSTVQQIPIVFQLPTAPGEHSANDRYSNDWGTYLASAEKVAYVTADFRGSSGSGQRVKHGVYRHMGVHEVDDIVKILQHIGDNLIYTNIRKTAVWGWAYGGFLASHVMANETNHCACGMMIGAFFDMLHQSTAFSERYMGFYSVADNKPGYEKSDVQKKTEYLRKKIFLIAHGQADDVVPFSNGMPLVKQLVDSDVPFSFQVYPDMTHSKLRGKPHFYRTLLHLLNQCWKKVDDRSFVKLDESNIPPRQLKELQKKYESQ